MTPEQWEARWRRERRARESAEALLEGKSLELYHANVATQKLNTELEQRVHERVHELARANARLELTQFAVDHAGDPIFWIDSEARFVYVNDAACANLGFSRDELLGMTVFDIDVFLPKEAWPEHWNELRRRGAFMIESVHRARDGREFPVEVAVNYLKMDGREYNCVFARDITERVAHETRTSRLTRLHEIVEQVTQSLLHTESLQPAIDDILATVGGFLGVARAYLVRFRESGQMAFATHEWCQPGVPPRADVLQEIPASAFGWWSEHLSLGRPVVVEDLSASHGSTSTMPDRLLVVLREHGCDAVLTLPVIVNGELTGMLGFEHHAGPRRWLQEEITLLLTIVESFSRSIERGIAEREREAHRSALSESLKRETAANRAKSLFLANMSHEIRTPLTAILGYTEMLAGAGTLSGPELEWVAHTRRSADHLQGLINDVLDLSKIEAGELTLSPEPVRLADTLRGVQALLRPSAEAKGLRLELESVGPVPERVTVDPTRLRQVLINLGYNAVKFTAAGEVRFRVEASTDSEHETPLRIEVRDTGIGIPPDQIESLFEPFQQGDDIAAQATGGVGLGLAISRKLAELMGGQLVAASVPGDGSVFTLHLPIHATSQDALDTDRPMLEATAAMAEGATLQGRRVCVIDDNPDNQRIIRYYLEEAGVVAISAFDGQQGVQTVLAPPDGQPFDAVLMDIQMPVMDGYLATRTIREQDTKIPIVALTAQAMADDKAKCLDAGCNRYISKPIVKDKLFATLVEVMGNNNASYEAKLQAQPNPSSVEIDPAETRSAMRDEPGFMVILEPYLESLAKMCITLPKHREAEDWPEVRRLLHNLHGTAGNYGFAMLGTLAAEGEAMIDQQQTGPELSDCLDRVEALLHAIGQADAA